MDKQIGVVSLVSNRDYCNNTFMWTIDNFRRWDRKSVGKYLRSPNFTTIYGKDMRWNLELYPAGLCEQDSQKFMSLYLYSNFEITAAITFVIFNNNGEKIVNYSLGMRPFTNETGWGNKRLIEQSFIKNLENGILCDDKLKIFCNIKYEAINNESDIRYQNGPFVTETYYEKVENYILACLILNDYESLLDDGEYSDVTLVSEGKPIKVHKCILAKKSAVFAAMFSVEMKENRENVVRISDVKYDVLLEMLRFAYVGKVKNIGTLAGELAIAADKYALNRLKNQCEKFMSENLSLDNVLVYLQIAEKIYMNALKKKAIDFIVTNSVDIKSQEEFNLLSRDTVWQIFRAMAQQK